MPLGLGTDMLKSVLPFLAALKKSSPDFSGMTSDDPSMAGIAQPGSNSSDPSQLVAAAQGDSSQLPPAPPPPMGQSASQPTNTLPNMAMPNQAPKVKEDKGSFFRQPYESKGNALMRILQGGLMGGLSGMAANANTYAATGRNAGFGGGVAAGYTQALPMERAMQGLGLEKAELGNEQLRQMLPFLRSQTIAGLQKTQAETQKASAEAEAIPVKTQLEKAQTEAAFFKDDPNLGVIDLRTRQPVSSAGLAPLTDEEAQVLGKQPGDRVPLKLKNTANEIVNRGYTTVNTEEGVYERNRGTGKQTRLGSNPRMMFSPSERIIPVAADPNNPGAVTFMKAGQAMASGAQAPGSAPVITAKATAKAVAPGGKVGEEINAFNTALQHADLLQKAAESLHNGDQQTLNSLKNRFSNEFGSTGPITANTIAQAYTREISKMLSSGHMTDSEIGAVGSTLDPNRQSLPQMMGVLQAYKALASSKMNVRRQGVQQGMQGKPNFPQNSQGGPTADDLLKRYPPK